MTTTGEKCSECGSIRPAQSPASQCVNCLLQLALEAAPGSMAQDTQPLDGLNKTFGDFALIEEIARGGMGVVWKARQVSLNRVVALKLLIGGQFANETAIKRFQFEAEAAADLDHPNIVPIFEIGEQEGHHYIAMKWIEGASLAQRLADFALQLHEPKKTPPAASSLTGESQGEGEHSSQPKSSIRQRQLTIAFLLAKIARAVHFAHQRGILHRDLKPPNILLDAYGEPHITDFGVARRVQADGHLTVTESILGSPYYMSPEQATGKSRHLSTASDVWSLGVILYELLTGRVPFKSDTTVVTLKLLVETVPQRPRFVNPAVHRELETICLKCLEKNPNHRYSSAEALAEDLDRWATNKPILARPSTPLVRAIKWVRREPLKGAVGALICLSMLGPWIVSRVYLTLLPQMATEHPVVTANRHGIYTLPLWHNFKGDRATDNFWRGPFDGTNRHLRLMFTNVPPELLPELRCLIRADQAGRLDPARTPELTNGQVFQLKVGSYLDRNFYVTSVGWNASNLLARAPQATVTLVLLPLIPK